MCRINSRGGRREALRAFRIQFIWIYTIFLYLSSVLGKHKERWNFIFAKLSKNSWTIECILSLFFRPKKASKFDLFMKEKMMKNFQTFAFSSFSPFSIRRISPGAHHMQPKFAELIAYISGARKIDKLFN